jgi:import receptor subunit TOM20
LKASNAASANGKSLPSDAELDAALQVVRSEELPTTPEAKEQYFMQNLAIGEQLAAQGEYDAHPPRLG